jgi:hypothetical protein
MDTPYEKLLAKLARSDVKFIIVGGVAVALNGFVRADWIHQVDANR